MQPPDKRTAGFILGSFLLLLFFILMFMLGGNENPDTRFGETPTIVPTNDPFITRQLSERDLLPDDVPLVTFLDPQRGPEASTITLVEFSDFQCPFCKELQGTLERLRVRFPELRHVWKDAPSQALHREAFSAHIAARCAQDQNAFWEYHDLLFENQERFSPETFGDIAETVGINVRTWKSCFENEETRVRVERSITEAEVLGIDATPFLFINDKRISGTTSFEELEQLITAEIIQ